MDSIGVALIARNVEKSIRDCVKSFINEVDQCVIVLAGESTDKTEREVNKLQQANKGKISVYNFTWIDDFAAARNYSFSKLKTDWLLWIDADDIIGNAANLREIIKSLPAEFGGVWFPYHYATDEFGNVSTLYERERLLRANCGWVWQGRLHETVSPLTPCKYIRTDKVVFLHNHLAGTPRNERNFKILNIMIKENPEDKRVWLYLGHQNFAAQQWMKAAEWYLKFGTDNGATPIERYQALCYCAKALREMMDSQCIDVSLKAIDLFPEYRDAYLELAHSYLRFRQYDKAIHFAMLSDSKDLMKDTPSIIFVNPLDYTFNKYALFTEAYLNKGELDTALSFAKMAHGVRPIKDIEQNIQYIEQVSLQHRVSDSIKVLATHLLNNKELVKLPYLLEVAPYWFRELPDYEQLRMGVEHYTAGLKNEADIAEGENKSVLVNIANATNLEKLLEELDTKYDKVTLISPMPLTTEKQSNTLSQSDMERLIITKEGRHIINLQQEERRLICEYDKTMPSGHFIRFYLGPGLENWSPKTIREQGAGGSEIAMAMLARELVKLNCYPIIYAMDNQIWDGVMFRHFSKFSLQGNPCNLFISSRVPELFNNDIPAQQKWLWIHDIHCREGLTPEVVSRIDAIITLTHWHAGHIKRVYPFLKDAEVIDLDNQDKTYEDDWTATVFYDKAKAYKLPKMAIIGNALDVERFQNLKEKRVPHRFIWCSSPDRGLEELLNLWAGLKKELPDAQLEIFYGWNYFDSTLFIPAQREFKERIRELIKQEGIHWRGRIGQVELARELSKSDALIYPPPHQFRETYGITFLEAQAAGVLCFYRQNGALGETIGKRGIPLRMDMTPEEIIKTVVDTLLNKEFSDRIRAKGQEYAGQRTWAKQAQKVLELYKLIEEGGNAET